MKPEWRDTLIQCLGPLVSLVLLLVVRHVRHLSWQDDIGLRWPSLGTSLRWIGAYIVLTIATELVSDALGLASEKSWFEKYSVGVIVVRSLVIVTLAPIAEELMFRGLLFSVLSSTRVGAIGAVALTALLFALMHFQYAGVLMLFVLIDAIYFGVARLATGSVLIPIICHMIGNSVAVYERLR